MTICFVQEIVSKWVNPNGRGDGEELKGRGI